MMASQLSTIWYERIHPISVELSERYRREGEKRHLRRAACDSRMAVYRENGYFLFAAGRLLNYSDTGVCFASGKSFLPGTEIRTLIRVNSRIPRMAIGHIVWARRAFRLSYYGLRFQ